LLGELQILDVAPWVDSPGNQREPRARLVARLFERQLPYSPNSRGVKCLLAGNRAPSTNVR
jgi:hypothetical protein